ncbi:MAG TPA: radical SAM protein [Candidatus Methanoperedenaceae archaeon]|nr:radical SAM protein [Candidatus Methanoperedenaceae archaeon]
MISGKRLKRSEYTVLSEECILRRLEFPFVYNTALDQLYELDDEALTLLAACDGTRKVKVPEYAISEGIVKCIDTPSKREIAIPSSPLPSLRYMLLHLTQECNLDCRHCYITKKEGDMTPGTFERAVRGFEDMGGIKLMLTGGEPLLHPDLPELLGILDSTRLHKVVLTNGTLIDAETARLLSGHVHEVQVSIDGIRTHDMLRGKGTFERAMLGIRNLKNAGVSVSIATMIHPHNISELGGIEKLCRDIGAVQWGVDVPYEEGDLKNNPEFVVSSRLAGRLLKKYGYGGGAHGSSGAYACGSHLCAVMADGSVSRCGFFPAVGSVDDLRGAWDKLCGQYLWTLGELQCSGCKFIQDCRGGCRYRALISGGSIRSPDPVMCGAYLDKQKSGT